MNYRFALSALMLSLLFSAPASANEPVAKVNGVAIPAIYSDIVKRDRAARGQEGNASDESVRDSLINVELMAQEASKRGIDKREDVQAVLELQRKETLVKLLQDDFVKGVKLTEDQVKNEYDKIKARNTGTEYHTRHILVATEKEANDLLAKLRASKKVKFEDLAKKHSKDSSAAEGGDLGWMSPTNLVPEFAAAMTALKKGAVSSKPVQTKFGWHIIKLEDSRSATFPEYDKVKNRIAQQMLQIEFRKFLADLRTTAKIETPAAK